MALGMEVGLGPVHTVLDGPQLLCPKRVERPPIFGPSLLWPNGGMHQDATWCGGRPQPRWLFVRWGPSPLPQKPQLIFSPRVLWPNGCMDQYAAWYGGRSMQHCVRCGPSYPQKKRAHLPPANFCPCLLWPNGWMDKDAAWYRSRPRAGPHCTRQGPSSREGAQQPLPLFGPCLLWPRSPISATAELLMSLVLYKRPEVMRINCINHGITALLAVDLSLRQL